MNIIDLLADHDITPKRVSSNKGGEYHSPCPGCGGEDRFHVWPEQNGGEGSFWCRGCGKGGDCLQFLRDFDGLSWEEAKARLGLPEEYGTKDIDRHRPAKPCWRPESKQWPANVQDHALWQEHAEKFIETCHQALLQDQQHLAWLAKRGISLEMVQKYRLGLHKTENWRPSFRPCASWGLAGGINPATGRPRMFVLPAGIVIPFFEGADLYRVRIRLEVPDPLDPDKRYHAVSGSRMATFITRTDAEVYAVIETELDAIMIDGQAGDMVGAVAVGSSHAKPTDTAGRALLHAKRILNALDYDKAGASATAWWQREFARHLRWPVPVGGDPGEFFEQRGQAAMRLWLQKGLPPVHQAAEVKLFLSIDPDQEQRRHQQAAKSQGHSAKAQDIRPDLPPDVLRLAELLAQCPVVIEKSETAYGIRKLPAYDYDQHWDLSCQISNLVFRSKAFDYLHTLPASMITAGNLLEGHHAH